MKQVNVFQPFLFSSFQHGHSLTLNDLKWKAFEKHDFLGDGEDWALFIENMLADKNPVLLEKLTFGDETMMFCIKSADKDALHEIAELVFSFYEDEQVFDNLLERFCII
jgi:hypothetical protein